jgi:acyl-CoA reductase-like NAD-dependent aldehyde dehydrogenase
MEMSAALMCTEAQQSGARAVTGGHAMNRPGWFLEPTIFDQVTPDMEIARDEIFGPVLSVLKFAQDDEAIANDTDYGLVGGVFTRDLDRATRVARHMRAGQFLSMNGMPVASIPLSAALANRFMDAKRAARHCGTTFKPKTSQSDWVHDHDR